MKRAGEKKKSSAPTGFGAPVGKALPQTDSRKFDAWICVALVALTLCIFGKIGGGEFVNYDDGENVFENPDVTRGLNINTIAGAFFFVHGSNWAPLTVLSHAVD